MFQIAYCDYYAPSKAAEWKDICKDFVDNVHEYRPDMLKKQKVHLILHLAECMEQFGPTSSFNRERYLVQLMHRMRYYPHSSLCRCETFNSFIRVQNIFGNKGAPSRDIAHHFAVVEQLRHICDGGSYEKGKR